MTARTGPLAASPSSVPALAAVLGGLLGALGGCASVPEPKFEKFAFPRNAYVGDVQRPYVVLGPVRSKVDYPSLDMGDNGHEESRLCRNYYNKAVRDLLKFARRQGADAVVDVQSVVFLEDGRRETYKTPECSDDGAEGQILTQGVAVKWKEAGAESGAWDTHAERPAAGGGASPGAESAAAAASIPAEPLAPVIETAALPVPEPLPAPTELPAAGSEFAVAGEGVELAKPRRRKPGREALAERGDPAEAAPAPGSISVVPRPQGPVLRARVVAAEARSRPPEPSRGESSKSSESGESKEEVPAPRPPSPPLNSADPRRALRLLP